MTERAQTTQADAKRFIKAVAEALGADPAELVVERLPGGTIRVRLVEDNANAQSDDETDGWGDLENE
ncbi:MAG: hypothetical protein AAGJ74_02640 [Pseudomonadota bacterium]